MHWNYTFEDDPLFGSAHFLIDKTSLALSIWTKKFWPPLYSFHFDGSGNVWATGSNGCIAMALVQFTIPDNNSRLRFRELKLQMKELSWILGKIQKDEKYSTKINDKDWTPFSKVTSLTFISFSFFELPPNKKFWPKKHQTLVAAVPL